MFICFIILNILKDVKSTFIPSSIYKYADIITAKSRIFHNSVQYLMKP